jgi:hypothetical protein
MTIDGDPPKLTSGNYEFDNAEELFTFLGENGKGEIRISRHNPSTTLWSDGRLYATVSTYDTSDASVALFQRIATTVRGCEGTKPLRDRGWVAFTSGAVFWLGIGQTVFHYKSWQAVPFACLAGIGLAMCIAIFRPRPRRDTVFYGIRRDARKSFWQRKRDDILANLIAAVIGAALGVGGTLLTQTLGKQ